ncbi:MAG: lamin tail domain-containing protein [Candidatus Eisenbacteria bacterium]
MRIPRLWLSLSMLSTVTACWLALTAASPRTLPHDSPLGPPVVTAPTLPRLSSAVPDVRLSEILAAPARDWDGSGAFSSRDDEWIEIVNGGAATTDLTGFFLTDGDTIPRYGFSGTLAPGAVQLVTGSASVAWERATAHPVFGLSLGNTGELVMLWQVVGTDTVLVDSYAYKAHESASDRATGRTPDGSTWKLEDQLNPYTGTVQPTGSGCPPTPGAANNCGVVAARRSSWGQVKTLYH